VIGGRAARLAAHIHRTADACCGVSAAALEPSRRAASGMERELPEVRLPPKVFACDLPIAVRMVRARGRFTRTPSAQRWKAVLKYLDDALEREAWAWRRKRSGCSTRCSSSRLRSSGHASGRSALRAGAASASALPADLLTAAWYLRAEMAWLDRRLATLHRPCDRGDGPKLGETLYTRLMWSESRSFSKKTRSDLAAG